MLKEILAKQGIVFGKGANKNTIKKAAQQLEEVGKNIKIGEEVDAQIRAIGNIEDIISGANRTLQNTQGSNKPVVNAIRKKAAGKIKEEAIQVLRNKQSDYNTRIKNVEQRSQTSSTRRTLQALKNVRGVLTSALTSAIHHGGKSRKHRSSRRANRTRRHR